MVKVLNLYSGIGGNRKLLPKSCEVTSVENNPDVAAIYQRLYPDDRVIVGDAHAYLLMNAIDYDFVWSSPPCQTHSAMNKATRHSTRRYFDAALWQEIVFLEHFAPDIKWVVENVKPYYEPLIPPSAKIGRHLFWSNFPIRGVHEPRLPYDFINLANLEGKKKLMDWLGIHFDEIVYMGGNHCPCQVLRNAVHPRIGREIYDIAMGIVEPTQFNLTYSGDEK